jgi:FtsH-binding integral membrane protein
MKQRYRALRTISKVYKYIGMAVLVFGIMAALLVSYQIGGYSPRFNVGLFVAALIGVIFSSLAFLAISELIHLMVSIEENTRASTQLLARLVRNQQGENQQPGA